MDNCKSNANNTGDITAGSIKILATSCKALIDGLDSGNQEASSVLNKLKSGLSEIELQRANKYRKPADTLRFAAGRTLVRRLLEASVSFKALVFETNMIIINESTGGSKPSLTNASKALFPNVCDFNISHDGDWIMAGVTAQGVLGIDVARVHCPENMSVKNYIAEFTYQLSPQEQDFLAKHSRQPLEDFYRIWTIKEAYLKAFGIGIAGSMELATISVSLSLDGNFVNVAVNGNQCALKFALGTLSGGKYVYALASTVHCAPSFDIVEIQ
ncbi:hypothetical protein BX661DRAFT_176503 [Kickxella alabastrina]|uniref:uncharacterized protein n=1 Tax=Kickxella alabastrina TaxID=61397 RepID=UPI00221E56C2|nr:uncharacterized protein BX661DRAFT_176503 [Kickxella alabastrina]KAI7834033.1 hypothetical protein BX661DRAFT_176503 [Kickxella alabastrina]